MRQKKQQPLLALLPLSVAEIRRLLARLIWCLPLCQTRSWLGPIGDGVTNTAKRAHYLKRGVILPPYLRL